MMKEQSEILKAIGRRQGVEDTASNREYYWGLEYYMRLLNF